MAVVQPINALHQCIWIGQSQSDVLHVSAIQYAVLYLAITWLLCLPFVSQSTIVAGWLKHCVNKNISMLFVMLVCMMRQCTGICWCNVGCWTLITWAYLDSPLTMDRMDSWISTTPHISAMSPVSSLLLVCELHSRLLELSDFSSGGYVFELVCLSACWIVWQQVYKKLWITYAISECKNCQMDFLKGWICHCVFCNGESC